MITFTGYAEKKLRRALESKEVIRSQLKDAMDSGNGEAIQNLVDQLNAVNQQMGTFISSSLTGQDLTAEDLEGSA